MAQDPRWPELPLSAWGATCETVHRWTQIVGKIELAIAGDWTAAHGIVQHDEADQTACWIHAALHKIEGDGANSRYWYRRAGQAYEAYADANAELMAIKAALTY